mgnify:FL=1
MKAILKGSKGKVLVVADPSRLSRNVNNFDEIWTICFQNKHQIAVVSINRVFNPCSESSLDLRALIANAERESREMGEKISRTAKYKKSREAPWGYMRNEEDRIVPNEREMRTNVLIRMLGTPGSSIPEIRRVLEMVGNMEGKEPFELVEYGDEFDLLTGKNVFKVKDLMPTRLPYAMGLVDIVETLKIYEVKMRRRFFKESDVSEILADKQVITPVLPSEDELIEDFVRMEVEREEKKEQEVQWITIYYDPAFGLPPNIRLPAGMQLPRNKGTIVIPRIE